MEDAQQISEIIETEEIETEKPPESDERLEVVLSTPEPVDVTPLLDTIPELIHQLADANDRASRSEAKVEAHKRQLAVYEEEIAYLRQQVRRAREATQIAAPARDDSETGSEDEPVEGPDAAAEGLGSETERHGVVAERQLHRPKHSLGEDSLDAAYRRFESAYSELETAYQEFDEQRGSEGAIPLDLALETGADEGPARGWFKRRRQAVIEAEQKRLEEDA